MAGQVKLEKKAKSELFGTKCGDFSLVSVALFNLIKS